MKKLILSLLVMVGVMEVAPAEIISLGDVSFTDLNEVSEETLYIQYENEDDEYILHPSDWTRNAYIYLTPEQFEAFKATISKTLDWCKIAHENNAEVEKELPDCVIEARAEWVFGLRDYRSASWDPIRLKFFFVSSIGNKGLVTALMFSAPRITSSYDEEVTYRFPMVFMIEDQIKKLSNVISQENIDAALKKHEDSKKLEELFN